MTTVEQALREAAESVEAARLRVVAISAEADNHERERLISHAIGCLMCVMDAIEAARALIIGAPAHELARAHVETVDAGVAQFIDKLKATLSVASLCGAPLPVAGWSCNLQDGHEGNCSFVEPGMTQDQTQRRRRAARLQASGPVDDGETSAPRGGAAAERTVKSRRNQGEAPWANHYHVRSDNGDACAHCGRDLRDPVHLRSVR